MLKHGHLDGRLWQLRSNPAFIALSLYLPTCLAQRYLDIHMNVASATKQDHPAARCDSVFQAAVTCSHPTSSLIQSDPSDREVLCALQPSLEGCSRRELLRGLSSLSDFLPNLFLASSCPFVPVPTLSFSFNSSTASLVLAPDVFIDNHRVSSQLSFLNELFLGDDYLGSRDA